MKSWYFVDRDGSRKLELNLGKFYWCVSNDAIGKHKEIDGAYTGGNIT